MVVRKPNSSKSELWNVLFSNGFGIRMFGIRAPTVLLGFWIGRPRYESQTSQPFACSLKTVRIVNNIGEREGATLVKGKENRDGKLIIFQVFRGIKHRLKHAREVKREREESKMWHVDYVDLIRRSVYMSVLLYVHLKNYVFPISLPSPLYQGKTLYLYSRFLNCMQKVVMSVPPSWNVWLKKPRTILLLFCWILFGYLNFAFWWYVCFGASEIIYLSSLYSISATIKKNY